MTKHSRTYIIISAVTKPPWSENAPGTRDLASRRDRGRYRQWEEGIHAYFQDTRYSYLFHRRGLCVFLLHTPVMERASEDTCTWEVTDTHFITQKHFALSRLSTTTVFKGLRWLAGLARGFVILIIMECSGMWWVLCRKKRWSFD